jgi:hypothetical protein
MNAATRRRPRPWAVLAVLSATAVASSSPLAAVDVWPLGDNDFTPCVGRMTPPAGGDEGGPWNQRLLEATSPDGRTWTRTHRILADAAGVPDALVDDHGRLYVYFVTWCPGVENDIAVAASDDGQTWTYKVVTLTGKPAGAPAVDPDVVLLADGRVRLFFTTAIAAHAGPHTAVSSDGLHFTYEGAAVPATAVDLFDPSAVLHAGTWHLYGGAVENGVLANGHSTGSDGKAFVYQEHLVTAPPIQLANGFVEGGEIHFWGFSNAPPGGIYRATSHDGSQWTVEQPAVLTEDPTWTLSEHAPIDPAVVRLSGGEYRMYYGGRIPDGAPGATPPAMPTGLAADPSSGAIALTWQDEADNESGVAVYRAAGSGAGSAIARVGVDVTSYRDATVTPGASYRYWLVADNNFGASAASAAVTVTASDSNGDSCDAGDGTVLCLRGGRFAVDVAWTDQRTGANGHGHGVNLAVSSALAGAGYFWFFDPANPELFVKLLDGAGVNGADWVFYGAVTDLACQITVRDLEHGTERRYEKPAGSLLGVADTSAFPGH